MNIHVTLDATPELQELLEGIAESLKSLQGIADQMTNAAAKVDDTLENGLDKKEVKKGKGKKEDTFDLSADSDVLDLTKDDPEMNEDDEPAPTKTKVSQKAPPAKKEEPKSKVSQKDVIKAFQAFAAKKGKEPAIKILKQYKVKKVVDIEPEDFDGVMKLLSK